VSRVVGVLIAAALFCSVIGGVMFALALRAADNSDQHLDALIDRQRPSDPIQVVSAASFSDWQDQWTSRASRKPSIFQRYWGQKKLRWLALIWPLQVRHEPPRTLC
jgi:hypothetical protein